MDSYDIDIFGDKIQYDRETEEDLNDVIYSCIEEDWITDHLYDEMEIEE